MLPGTTSDWVYLLAGVPQGSILRLILFLPYINDIVNAIGANICIFADDTGLFIVVDNPLASAICFNTDLLRLTRRAATWLETFNPTKNQTFLISRKIINPYQPPVYMQNCQLTDINAHKHLYIYFSSDCSF